MLPIKAWERTLFMSRINDDEDDIFFDLMIDDTPELPKGFKSIYEPYKAPKLLKCTCGTEAVQGDKHSDWCDLVRKDV